MKKKKKPSLRSRSNPKGKRKDGQVPSNQERENKVTVGKSDPDETSKPKILNGDSATI